MSHVARGMVVLEQLEFDVVLVDINVWVMSQVLFHTLTRYVKLFMFELMSHVTYADWSLTCCSLLFMESCHVRTSHVKLWRDTRSCSCMGWWVISPTPTGVWRAACSCLCMSHITCVRIMSRADEPCRTLEWCSRLLMYESTSHVTQYNWSLTCCLWWFMYESCHVRMSHVTCGWVITHSDVINVWVMSRADESCLTLEWCA